MTITQTAQAVEQFLEDYIARDEYVDESMEPKMWIQTVSPIGSAVLVTFGIDASADSSDPELQRLAQQAIDALRAARPDLAGVRIDHEISA